jgi:hypothetical protein
MESARGVRVHFVPQTVQSKRTSAESRVSMSALSPKSAGAGAEMSPPAIAAETLTRSGRLDGRRLGTRSEGRFPRGERGQLVEVA